jgi:hypothetical protein
MRLVALPMSLDPKLRAALVDTVSVGVGLQGMQLLHDRLTGAATEAAKRDDFTVLSGATASVLGQISVLDIYAANTLLGRLADHAQQHTLRGIEPAFAAAFLSGRRAGGTTHSARAVAALNTHGWPGQLVGGSLLTPIFSVSASHLALANTFDIGTTLGERPYTEGGVESALSELAERTPPDSEHLDDELTAFAETMVIVASAIIGAIEVRDRASQRDIPEALRSAVQYAHAEIRGDPASWTRPLRSVANGKALTVNLVWLPIPTEALEQPSGAVGVGQPLTLRPRMSPTSPLWRGNVRLPAIAASGWGSEGEQHGMTVEFRSFPRLAADGRALRKGLLYSLLNPSNPVEPPDPAEPTHRASFDTTGSAVLEAPKDQADVPDLPFAVIPPPPDELVITPGHVPVVVMDDPSHETPASAQAVSSEQTSNDAALADTLETLAKRAKVDLGMAADAALEQLDSFSESSA